MDHCLDGKGTRHLLTHTFLNAAELLNQLEPDIHWYTILPLETGVQ